ncbi:MAG TPA: DUF1801 domain-containing protein [Chitinophagales bacterium]|mgnify:FL=1|jgi:hypothetical protein|nr:DUF1801 domain-containing protein [Chitinophagales bacterium]MBP6153299.1 DUF1801 domain-containing protein [Chitinophagales bacterium]HQV78441.1 DUF1801 domain-containing protein [Chitinophagales bacterium]HQW78873.1 DUF1801 domain-containing protein [Chitinophagales bacterium]HRB67311.1 DUF1801 domain-containing protein [Chitinophagales bacterium]
MEEILLYHQSLAEHEQQICTLLSSIITKELNTSTCKIWHRHPVWFINNNPIVGYSKQKAGIRLMFWSGIDFHEPILSVEGRKFKDASVFFNAVNEIDIAIIKRCLHKSKIIQWDYKNLIKRKGKLLKVE